MISKKCVREGRREGGGEEREREREWKEST